MLWRLKLSLTRILSYVNSRRLSHQVSWRGKMWLHWSISFFLFWQGPRPLARAAHTAVRVDMAVYIFGGRNMGQRMGDLHKLDLQDFTWSGEWVPALLHRTNSNHRVEKIRALATGATKNFLRSRIIRNIWMFLFEQKTQLLKYFTINKSFHLLTKLWTIHHLLKIFLTFDYTQFLFLTILSFSWWVQCMFL